MYRERPERDWFGVHATRSTLGAEVTLLCQHGAVWCGPYVVQAGNFCWRGAWSGTACSTRRCTDDVQPKAVIHT